jgi:hypothetical protein
VTWLAESTLVSRATNLPQLLTIAGSWRFCQPAIVKILTKKAPELTGVYAQSPWDVFSQDSSIISKIALMSASDTGDFLRLAGELTENCHPTPARDPPCWEVPFF